ncbi:MAG: hypothetical protein ACK5NM_12865, partial [Cyclobacteriaceae bacterium]
LSRSPPSRLAQNLFLCFPYNFRWPKWPTKISKIHLRSGVLVAHGDFMAYYLNDLSKKAL